MQQTMHVQKFKSNDLIEIVLQYNPTNPRNSSYLNGQLSFSISAIGMATILKESQPRHAHKHLLLKGRSCMPTSSIHNSSDKCRATQDCKLVNASRNQQFWPEPPREGGGGCVCVGVGGKTGGQAYKLQSRECKFNKIHYK